jgi:hypothetical protein
VNHFLEFRRRASRVVFPHSLRILAFGATLAAGLAADEKKSAETPPSEPADISLEELTKMEIPSSKPLPNTNRRSPKRRHQSRSSRRMK